MKNVEKIDVCCCTRYGPPKWWYKQLDNIPLNKLIIDRSTPLGFSRMNSIQKVETSWFAFIDDDVLTGENWYKELTSFIKDDVGAIAGRAKICGLGKKWDDEINYFRWENEKRLLKLGERGWTINTLIKTNLVKDWIPSKPDLASWEDYEITQHILKKGNKWLDVRAPAVHYGWSWCNTPKKCSWTIKGQKMVAPHTLPKYTAKLLLSTPIYFIKGLTLSRLRVATFLTWQHFWMIISLLLS